MYLTPAAGYRCVRSGQRANIFQENVWTITFNVWVSVHES